MGSPAQVMESVQSRLRFTTTQTINGNGNLIGLICSTSTGGTLTIVDTVGTIVSALPVMSGQWVPLPFAFVGPLTITVAGTLDCTIGYQE